MGGLIWAYVGPAPAPELPRFDTYVMDGFRDIGWADLPCNYVQIMENAVDPHHVEFLHGRYFEFVGRHEGFTAPASFGKEHVKIGFTPFEWGIIKRRVLKGATEENDDWKVGHPLVFPYNMRVGGGGCTRCRSGCRSTAPPPGSCSTPCTAPTATSTSSSRVPDYQIPVSTENGRHVTNYVEGQDIMAWVTQGPITDRTTEHLGRSDIGVAMLRKMFREQMDMVARGEDPLGTIREPHERIDLPCEKDKFNAGGAQFALDFCDMGSHAVLPDADTIKKLHIKAWENREAALVTALPSTATRSSPRTPVAAGSPRTLPTTAGTHRSSVPPARPRWPSRMVEPVWPRSTGSTGTGSSSASAEPAAGRATSCSPHA